VRFDEHRGALAFMYAVDGRTPLRWHLASNAVDETSGTVVSRPKDEREEHRLFYVALTRARDVIYVTGCLPPPLKAGSVCLDAVSTWFSDCGIDPATTRLVDEDTPPPALAAQPTLPGVDIGQLTHRLEAQLAREAVAPEPASRRGLLSYTAIALHEACPRRSRYHYVLGLPDLSDEAPALPGEGDHRESPRRDPARFGRVVHLVLESVALARIAGKPPDVEFALNAALEEEECAGDTALRDDARRAVDAALSALSRFTPVAAEERFDVEIDGVPLYGYIDLLARNAAGELMIVDYKTGTTPSEHYAMQFALYQRAIRERYPEAAQTLLLRIEANRAALEAVVPASHDALAAAIAAAHSMDSDEPRPGAQCRTCPYAQNICDAAARPASIAQ
jgi:RecB family exonuclease